MKNMLRLALVMILASQLTACWTTYVYVDKFTTLTPADSQFKNYDVPPPPSAAASYAVSTPDEKESWWTTYTTDLLKIIGLHMADKDGLVEWKKVTIQKTEELNKKIEAEKKK